MTSRQPTALGPIVFVAVLLFLFVAECIGLAVAFGKGIVVGVIALCLPPVALVMGLMEMFS